MAGIPVASGESDDVVSILYCTEFFVYEDGLDYTVSYYCVLDLVHFPGADCSQSNGVVLNGK